MSLQGDSSMSYNIINEGRRKDLPNPTEGKLQMTTAKLTQRQVYARIMEVMSDDMDVVEFCERKIAQLDKPKSLKKVQEREQFLNAVADAIDANGKMTSAQVAEKLGVSWQKVSNAIRQLVLDGVVVKAGYDENKRAMYEIL